jgi:hypothetical protein
MALVSGAGVRAVGVLLLGAAAPMSLPLHAAPNTHTLPDRLHARALESFRQGRFPEAYGRFMGLANAGHPASARYALWMCENGLALFGKDWDCAPHEVEDWARAAGVAVLPIASAQALPGAAPRPAVRR